MRLKTRHRQQLRTLYLPDITHPQIIPRHQRRTIARNRHTPYGDIFIRHQFMRTRIFTQVPYFHTARLVAADQLALIGVDDNVVDGGFVFVFTLNACRARVPYSDSVVLGACDEPFAPGGIGQGGDVAAVSV